MNLSCPTSTAVRTPALNNATIPNAPTSFASRSIGTNHAPVWCLEMDEAVMKHIQTVMKHKHGC